MWISNGENIGKFWNVFKTKWDLQSNSHEEEKEFFKFSLTFFFNFQLYQQQAFASFENKRIKSSHARFNKLWRDIVKKKETTLSGDKTIT